MRPAYGAEALVLELSEHVEVVLVEHNSEDVAEGVNDGRGDLPLELVARTLAGWAEFVTVESPTELQLELARLGTAVASRHAASVG